MPTHNLLSRAHARVDMRRRGECGESAGVDVAPRARVRSDGGSL